MSKQPNKEKFHDFYNGQYFQTIVFYGEMRDRIPEYLSKLEFSKVTKIAYSNDTTALLGVGPYFPPLRQPKVDCRCLEPCCEVLPPFGKLTLRSSGIYKPFPKECDLTRLVEFLRTGGSEYGYSTDTRR